jgi:calcium permeable stress-gated cation channel
MFICATVLGILVFSGMLLLPVLLPLAGTDDALSLANKNNKTAGNFSELEKLAMGNVLVIHFFPSESSI